MQQIKTITKRLDNASAFDKEVNAALAEGWTLAERKVIRPQAHPDKGTSYTMLYAAMEKHIITEDEKRCENCKHGDLPPDASPCRDCSEEGDKWEAAEGEA